MKNTTVPSSVSPSGLGCENRSCHADNMDAVINLWDRCWKTSRRRCDLWTPSEDGGGADQSHGFGSSLTHRCGGEPLRAESPTPDLCTITARTQKQNSQFYVVFLNIKGCGRVKPPQRCMRLGIFCRRWLWGWTQGSPPLGTVASWLLRFHSAQQHKHEALQGNHKNNSYVSHKWSQLHSK